MLFNPKKLRAKTLPPAKPSFIENGTRPPVNCLMRKEPTMPAWPCLFATPLIALWFVSASVAGQDEAEIARLIRQLGSEKFKEREMATASLTKVGKPALTALSKAAKESD